MDIEQRLRDAFAARARTVSISKKPGPVKKRPRRLWPIIALVVTAGVLVSGVAVGGLTIFGHPEVDASGGPSSSTPQTPTEGGLGQRLGDPNHPGHPDSSAMKSLNDADVNFTPLTPDTQWTNSKTVIGLYQLPSAVALDYAPPAAPSKYVRQAYIEVYESAWDPSKDVLKSYQEMFAGDDFPGESLTTIDGQPALVVSAHSPADDEQANPAFVRVVVNGVELQISGGEDLSLLEQIASSMIQASRTLV